MLPFRCPISREPIMPRIAIVVRGGVVQDVFSDEHVEIEIIDYDDAYDADVEVSQNDYPIRVF